ncbi:hypothetical protein AB6A40_009092 [Gnathostoma spinigerum]|uniref:Uncharacterized protein n=1 Tax=Gnathostoma spinigerum TaxID=75299 RepID=A0ABD6ERB5_9BILA
MVRLSLLILLANTHLLGYCCNRISPSPSLSPSFPPYPPPLLPLPLPLPQPLPPPPLPPPAVSYIVAPPPPPSCYVPVFYW